MIDVYRDILKFWSVIRLPTYYIMIPRNDVQVVWALVIMEVNNARLDTVVVYP